MRAAVLTRQKYDDLAPLPVIVTEAGGRITDLNGGPVLAWGLEAMAVPVRERSPGLRSDYSKRQPRPKKLRAL